MSATKKSAVETPCKSKRYLPENIDSNSEELSLRNKADKMVLDLTGDIIIPRWQGSIHSQPHISAIVPYTNSRPPTALLRCDQADVGRPT